MSVLRESAELEWCSEKVRNLVRGGGKGSDPESVPDVIVVWILSSSSPNVRILSGGKHL